MIKLISIDDHRIFYDGMQAIIAQEKDMILLKGYPDGKDIQHKVSRHNPDILLLDMYLQEESGLALARTVKKTSPQVKIIILSLEVSPVFINELKEIGVEGYVSKELSAADLIHVIRTVYEGETIYGENPRIEDTIKRVLERDFGLTAKELEIYEYIQQGKTSQEIADILNRSVLTVRTHRKNIHQKIRLKERGF